MASHYVRVYAPDGQPFDVNVERASELILNSGWTRTRVVDAGEPNIPHVTTLPRKRSRRFKTDE